MNNSNEVIKELITKSGFKYRTVGKVAFPKYPDYIYCIKNPTQKTIFKIKCAINLLKNKEK